MFPIQTALSTHERFIGFPIEHYASNLPLWRAPDRVRIITSGAEDDAASGPFVKYAKSIADELRGQMVRVSTDFGNHPIKAKVQDAAFFARIPTLHLIGYGSHRSSRHGKRHAESGLRRSGPQGVKRRARSWRKC